ncbi:unnamed protein product [Didymodactylos carnosus]|uniref:Uncharacterized protein n=1 Tax=Didymodactylos carnosus TaxID=1234261 RepID=A0A815GR69_9BILA|nr:unnamed protein product [Didymodactylos carnosus]CAF4207235.1 unnamed protein product [Didymodactylos carnosus]
MHPIRHAKEQLASDIQEASHKAPELVKNVVCAVGDQVSKLNEKIFEPGKEQLAEDLHYRHGGKREKLLTHAIGVGKYEKMAHFLNDNVVQAMKDKENDNAKVVETKEDKDKK